MAEELTNTEPDQVEEVDEESTKILDEDDNEITMDQVDFSLGYLKPDRLFIKHHDAIEFQEEQWHYVVKTYYFENGTQYDVTGEDDPHIEPIDADNGVFGYKPQTEEEQTLVVKGIDLAQHIDKEQVDAKEAWDEYEDIQRYILYTPEELEEIKKQEEETAKKENFMATGPERLDTAEDNIGDLSIILSDVVFQTMDLDIGGTN